MAKKVTETHPKIPRYIMASCFATGMINGPTFRSRNMVDMSQAPRKAIQVTICEGYTQTICTSRFGKSAYHDFYVIITNEPTLG